MQNIPNHAEFIFYHAVQFAVKSFLKIHIDLAAFFQLIEYSCDFIFIIKADSRVDGVAFDNIRTMRCLFIINRFWDVGEGKSAIKINNFYSPFFVARHSK